MSLPLIRVTQVLGYFIEPELANWKARVGNKEANRIMKLASKLGTRVHEQIYRRWQKGAFSPIKSDGFEVKNCMKAYIEWESHYMPEIVEMEIEVKRDDLGVVGHFDQKARIKDRLYIVDFKNSNHLTLKNLIQVNVYNWLDGERCTKVALLRLDKNLGTYQFAEYDYDFSLVKTFIDMVNVYRVFNGFNEAQNSEGVGNAYTRITEGKIGERRSMDSSEDCASGAGQDREITAL